MKRIGEIVRLSPFLVVVGWELVFSGGQSLAAPPKPVDSKADHWAFQPIRRPDMPAVRDRSWVRTPIDTFILARLQAENLTHSPSADKRTLLRRVYLDLIGLPPTPEEQTAFLEDPRPDAFARVVDRLLARAEYGERWARHWLDVVRYAETNGYERDGDKPSAWRYRDYVIDSFNKDKPFSQFLLEQLAGDEIPGSNGETQIATTFLRLGTWDDEPAETMVDRYDQLDDVLGVTATAFMGLTLRCARCHDHKFEPFSQADYYRMLAVFDPLKRPQKDRQDLDRPVGTEQEVETYHQSAVPAIAKAEAEFVSLEKRLDELLRRIQGRLFENVGKPPDKVKGDVKTTRLPAEVVAALKVDAKKRNTQQRQLIKRHAEQWDKELHEAATPDERRERRHIEEQIANNRSHRPRELPRAYIWYEESNKAPTTRILRRGDPAKPDQEVQPGTPTVLASFTRTTPQPTPKTTGRRLWLAQWLTQADHPLTARVIVNRVWQQHFGKGLVGTPNDFGVMGEAPSHPELLDWLASQFIADGWRLKPLHRAIVLSNVYQTSSGTLAGKNADKLLDVFGRWRQRRLQAETVRDAVLAVSGRLNSERGGPGVYPPLPRAVLEGQSRPGDGWGKSDDRQASRRSIYIFCKRSLAVPELDLLDAPDTTSSCEQRLTSTTAPQALTLLNGAFMQEQARHFAERLQREAGSDSRPVVRRAIELAYCRPARPEEESLALAFLAEQTRRLETESQVERTKAQKRALAAFCLVLLNSNEFAYPG